MDPRNDWPEVCLVDEIDEFLAKHAQDDGLGREIDELRPWFFRDLEAELEKKA
ncbi:hypothetical protein HY251_16980 [bacterium]|nr:hypothetical protein [bacterium]